MKPAGPPLSPRSAVIRDQYTFCDTHLRMETSNMLKRCSVSVAVVELISSYMKTASQVIKMVHVKPTIDMKPKLRFEYQLRTAPFHFKTSMTPSELAVSLNERGHRAAAHHCPVRAFSQTHAFGSSQLHEHFVTPSQP